jgi:hypothetical protein
MPTERTPGGTASPGGLFGHLADKQITLGFAGVILLALVLLFALRQIFGSIRVEAGTR